MIRYHVSFSLKAGTHESGGLARVEGFLEQLRGRGLIHAFVLSRTGEEPLQFRVSISFLDERQFRLPFQEVEQLGIHSGPHGFMIEGVDAFKVDVARDITELQTPRLRLRQWRPEDRVPFAALNADPAVMEFFPTVLSLAESDALAKKIEGQIAERGWGLWAVELLDAGEPSIGFVGLSVPADLPFCPCVEVGWRLAKAHWGRGYATEAARAAMEFGFRTLALNELVSFTTVMNRRSRSVMERLGMQVGEFFDHPQLPAGHPLKPHVLYRLNTAQWSR